MTGSEILAEATRKLVAAGIPDAGRDARRLLAHVLKVPMGRLTLFLPEDVDPELTVVFRVMIERRAERVPVSHLTGRRMFYGRDFIVSKDVLDPRPETETLIETALAAPFGRVLDLGTGSGCILLTLLLENETAEGVGADLSPEALNVAYWNSNALGLEPRSTLVQGSWFDALGPDEQYFDLIVSNPPYIALSEMFGLEPEVRDHEPRMALTDGSDGLSAYRIITSGAPHHLLEGGRLIVEIGPTQGQAVSEMMRKVGFSNVQITQDLDGRDRVVQGVWAG